MKLAAFAAAVMLLAGPAFADGHSAKDLQVLRDSAGALSADHPDLAKRLQALADAESKETETDETEGQLKQGRDLGVVQESADALRTTRPDLAEGLRRFAKEERAEQREDWSKRSERHENER